MGFSNKNIYKVKLLVLIFYGITFSWEGENGSNGWQFGVQGPSSTKSFGLD